MQQLIDSTFYFLKTVKGCSIVFKRETTYLNVFIDPFGRKTEKG